MTKKEWKELEKLSCKNVETKRYKILLKKTEKENEHPEWYEGACDCLTCISYT